MKTLIYPTYKAMEKMLPAHKDLCPEHLTCDTQVIIQSLSSYLDSDYLKVRAICPNCKCLLSYNVLFKRN